MVSESEPNFSDLWGKADYWMAEADDPYNSLDEATRETLRECAEELAALLGPRFLARLQARVLGRADV